MLACDSVDDFLRIGGSGERFRLCVLHVDEATNDSLKVGERAEHAALQLPLCELGKEPFDGVEP